MDTKTVMVEAVVNHDDVKEVFKAFCDDKSALSPAMSVKSGKENLDVIVAGFRTADIRQHFVGKMERLFPGKISWR